MKLDFTGLKALGETKEDTSQPATQPPPDLFKRCWEMLESYYNMNYDNETAWEAIIDLSERIYQAEKARAERELTEAESEMIAGPIIATMKYIETISKYRHNYTYTIRLCFL